MSSTVNPTNPSSWTDPAALASYITSVLAALVSVLAMIHPGFSLPSSTETWVASIAGLIAGGVQVFNLVTHRSVTKTIISNTPKTTTHTTPTKAA